MRRVRPDYAVLSTIPHGVAIFCIGADGEKADVHVRALAPDAGVNEDPVTGSAHTVLAPYWSAKLGRDTLVGYQASRRGGRVGTRVAGDRVVLTGSAVTVLDGTIEL
jgi:predicted PhzF superfamily epimerase YddE/YHI9